MAHFHNFKYKTKTNTIIILPTVFNKRVGLSVSSKDLQNIILRRPHVLTARRWAIETSFFLSFGIPTVSSKEPHTWNSERRPLLRYLNIIFASQCIYELYIHTYTSSAYSQKLYTYNIRIRWRRRWRWFVGNRTHI